MTNKPTATEGPVNDPRLSFEIEGPDGDDFVWLISGNDRRNLGRSADVAEKFSQWLASIDYQDGVVRIKRMPTRGS